MAWTTPVTAVANAALTASQWNASVRDNLLETAVAKATTQGRHFVATGVNTIAEQDSQQTSVGTSEGTTSTSYTDLATTGPTVTLAISGRAWVALYAGIANSGINASAMGFDISGASTVAALDSRAISVRGVASNWRIGGIFLQAGLTSGSTTFKAQYRVTGDTGTYTDRRIAVFGF